MKKQYTAVALALSAALVLTGCSWSDIKAKFVGGDSASSTSVTSDGQVIVEDYDPNSCITLADYKGVEVDCTVSDDEVQSEIDQLLSDNSTTKKVKKGTAKDGTTVNIDYVGKMDGTEFDGGSGEDYSLTLGSGTFITDLEDGIVGMKVGETKDVNVTFPESYSNTDLAGKDAVFTVTVNYIEKTITPELTDAFIKKNTEYKTISAYKKATKKELAQTKKDSASSTALQTIIDNTSFDNIPASLQEAQKQQMDNYYRNQVTSYYGDSTDFETALGSMGMTSDQYDSMLDSSAESTTKIILVVEAIAAKENITPDDEEINSYLEETVSAAGATVDSYREQYESYYGKAISFEDFSRTSYLYDKVLEFINDTLVIKED